MANDEVEPVPKPTMLPGFTRLAAFFATALFKTSWSLGSMTAYDRQNVRENSEIGGRRRGV